jgi:hypothetical protein
MVRSVEGRIMVRMLVCLSAAFLLPLSAAAQVSVTVAPMLKTYCLRCHNEKAHAAGLMLDKIDTDRVRVDAEVWEKILRQLRARAMPPPGALVSRPDIATYESAITELETQLDRLAAPLKVADRVTDLVLASRIAALLWGAPPDAALLDAAKRGDLGNTAGLEKQVKRMIADPQSRKFVADFLAKWLHVDNIMQTRMDPEKFALFKGNILSDLTRETTMFLASQFRENHAATGMFTANYTFMNSELAKLYDIPGVYGPQFVRVTFSEDRRAGILGLAGFLTVTSFDSRTSATMRGKWLLDVFFGIRPPVPPPGLPLAHDFKSRRQLDTAYSQRACSGCHFISQLGGPLENFDDIGRWRTSDLGKPVDASGMLPDGTIVDGPVQLRDALMKYRQTYIMTLSQKLMAYALGRGTDGRPVYWQEMPAVRAIVRGAAANDYRWSSLIVGIVQSAPFQAKKVLP